MGIGIYNIFKIYILTEISSGPFLNQSKSPSEDILVQYHKLQQPP